MLYRLLDRPWVYRLQRAVLAPGNARAFNTKFGDLLTRLPAAQRVLDVGCGPASWLFDSGLHPVGVDVSLSYMREYRGRGERAVVGSADALPFAAGSWDAVWSIGVLHHLPDGVAAAAIAEMLRVCRPGGYVVVLDAVMPRRAWQRPLAYGIRRLDRGRFVRSEDALRRLFPGGVAWQFDRFTFAWTGLEAVIGWARVGGVV
jgi:SAM-dependent methyltransferase